MDEFATITFTSTAVRRTGEAEFELDGDLTLKRIARPVTIPFTCEGTAQDPFGNVRVGFEGGSSFTAGTSASTTTPCSRAAAC